MPPRSLSPFVSALSAVARLSDAGRVASAILEKHILTGAT